MGETTTTKIRDALITGAIGIVLGQTFLNPVVGVIGESFRYLVFQDPIAKASIAESTNEPILENQTFTLTAAGSRDPDPWGGNLLYTWRQTNNNGIYASPKINVETFETEVNFTAPNNLVNDVVLSFDLTVQDSQRAKKNYTLEVPVKSNHPLNRQWGEFNYFNNPVGIAVENIYGSVFVIDRNNNQIQKFDSDGDFMTKWGEYGDGSSAFYKAFFNNPSGIAVDPNWERRYIFVADSGNNRIQKFEEWSEHKDTWGSFCDIKTKNGCNKNEKRLDENGVEVPVNEDGDGQFHFPTGVAVDKNGNVYVADTSNHRIQKFDNNGMFIKKWGSVCILEFEDGKCNRNAKRLTDTGGIVIKHNVTEKGDGQFFDPRGIAVDENGTAVYVVDKRNSRIQKFDANGNFLLKWDGKMDGNKVTTNNTRGLEGHFDPTYIAVDPESGNVYVTDERYKRVDEFDANGTFIRYWTIPDDGKNTSLRNPAGIAISPLHPHDIYVADAVSNRINIFGLKHNN